MTRFTYIPSRDHPPTPEPEPAPAAESEKVQYYYHYDDDSAGRLTSAAPKKMSNCHCRCHCNCDCGEKDKPTPANPIPSYVCFYMPTVPSQAAHGTHFMSFPEPPADTHVKTPEPMKGGTECSCHLEETPNIPAYCLPEHYAKKAEKAPVVYLPNNVTYSYPAHGQPAGHFYPPNYVCYPTEQEQAEQGEQAEHSQEPSMPWKGSTKEEVDIQNRAIHYEHQDQVQAVPYEHLPADHQYWCKELDGSYTLRTVKEIGDECCVGHWQLSKENYWYWVRDPEDESASAVDV